MRAMEALKQYFEAEHGRRVALARELGITPGAVSQWSRVPAERLIEIERVTGIRRELLRPDLFTESSAEGAAA
jgi:DNA-binding transcriptional regulator YdaS (Cro superfamily)